MKTAPTGDTSKIFNGTWADWQSLTPDQRDAKRVGDMLHPQLVGLEGKRVRVTPKRPYGRSTFRVGISTGWRPIHLAMRGGAHGSSDAINSSEKFDSVVTLRD